MKIYVIHQICDNLLLILRQLERKNYFLKYGGD